MRKNIEYLSKKLEDIFKDKENLKENNDYSQMEKGQLKEELKKLNVQIMKLQEQKDYQESSLNAEIKALRS